MHNTSAITAAYFANGNLYASVSQSIERGKLKLAGVINQLGINFLGWEPKFTGQNLRAFNHLKASYKKAYQIKWDKWEKTSVEDIVDQMKDGKDLAAKERLGFCWKRVEEELKLIKADNRPFTEKRRAKLKRIGITIRVMEE